MFNKFPTSTWLVLVVVVNFIAFSTCTIDMNLSEFQYLADHMGSEECRTLAASLYFSTYELPNALPQAVRKIPQDISCVQQLLHWNSEPSNGGKGLSHDFVSRRLKQLGREDLANWLAQTAVDALGNDFMRSVTDAFKMYQPIHLPYVNLTSTTAMLKVTTDAPHVRIAKQDFPPAPPAADVISDPTEWTIFDTISWTIVILLFLLVIVLLIYLTMASPCCNKDKHKQCECKEFQNSASAPPAPCYCPPPKHFEPSTHSTTCPAFMSAQNQQPFAPSYPTPQPCSCPPQPCSCPPPQPCSCPPPQPCSCPPQPCPCPSQPGPPQPQPPPCKPRHLPPCPCPPSKQTEFNLPANQYNAPCTPCAIHGHQYIRCNGPTS